MATGKKTLIRFKKRWVLRLWLEIFLYALGPALLCYFLSQNLLWSSLVFFEVLAALTFIKKPWNVTLTAVSGYLDQKLETTEYSSGLLLSSEEELSGLARLQQKKVSRQLQDLKKLQIPTQLGRAFIITALLIGLGIAGQRYNLVKRFQTEQRIIEEPAKELVVTKDSIAVETVPPELVTQQVTINYPAYTNLPSVTSSKLDIKAVKGSWLTWQLKFNTEVDSVMMEHMGSQYSMQQRKDFYFRRAELKNSGIYNFKFQDSMGNSFLSDLYSIQMVEDQKPVVEIDGLDQFSSFEHDEEKQISFMSKISDDFGISEAAIIATVSKGSGESVKFREERLDFNGKVRKGSKTQQLLRKIDLEELKMEPGDELYFYVEARDLKQPEANVSRSETFFAVIKDTVGKERGVEGGLGVDLMPAYFRSQRQLIIDTEQLISEKSEIPKQEFNARSNELAADQKALRLKHGKFMGDESESETEPGSESEHQHSSAQTGEMEEDPLAKYSHAHDSENEHNLVPQEEKESETGRPEDPLKEYLHNHADPEESTLFTESLKAKLRRALDIMWDAELYLRMYEPEKSLPYQYQVLELLQEIKNSARIYVHRIGFDPPPIKEEVRLTGEIKDVSHFQKTEALEEEEVFFSLRQAVNRLEELIQEDSSISGEDRQLFELAGSELAVKAIEEPGRHLRTLQQLKRLSEVEKTSVEDLRQVQRGLLKALPKIKSIPGGKEGVGGSLNELLIRELEKND